MDFPRDSGQILFRREVHLLIKAIPIPSTNPVSSWEDALRQFLGFKRAQGLRDSTIYDYDRFTRQFFSRYPGSWPDSNRLRSAAIGYLSDKMKPSTYNLRLTYLKGFFAWCIDEGFLSENPMRGFRIRKTDRRDVDIDPEIILKLVQAPNRKTFVGTRDYALIMLSLDSGIRPKEAFSLRLDDINFPALEVYIRPEASKTKVSRTIHMLPPTANAIKDLIRKREPRWGKSVPLFCSQDGLPLNKDSWNDRMEVYSRKIGFKIRPYDLRHEYGIMSLRNRQDAFGLMRLMGHTSMETTEQYLALADSDLKGQHDESSPLRTLGLARTRVGRRGGSTH